MGDCRAPAAIPGCGPDSALWLLVPQVPAQCIAAPSDLPVLIIRPLAVSRHDFGPVSWKAPGTHLPMESILHPASAHMPLAPP